jgi:hypothetical protein
VPSLALVIEAYGCGASDVVAADGRVYDTDRVQPIASRCAQHRRRPCERRERQSPLVPGRVH